MFLMCFWSLNRGHRKPIAVKCLVLNTERKCSIFLGLESQRLSCLFWSSILQLTKVSFLQKGLNIWQFLFLTDLFGRIYVHLFLCLYTHPCGELHWSCGWCNGSCSRGQATSSPCSHRTSCTNSRRSRWRTDKTFQYNWTNEKQEAERTCVCGTGLQGSPCLTLDFCEVANTHSATYTRVEVPANLQVGMVCVWPENNKRVTPGQKSKAGQTGEGRGALG